MFDNSRYNIILLADASEPVVMTKTFGVYKVAHELRKAGFECAVIHHLHIFTYQEIKMMLGALISDTTLYVGFSTFFYQQINDQSFYQTPFTDRQWNSDVVASSGPMLPYGSQVNQDLIALIKSCNPRCATVLGGPNAVDKKHNGDFDYVVVGYADCSAVNLACHLSRGDKLQHSYRSIWGPIIVNDPKAQGFDFPNSTMWYQDHDAILPQETLQIEVSRGCIFQCAYCSFPLNGKKKLDFLRSEQRLREEFLTNYQRWGVTRYMFLDDTFNDSVEKCELMLKVSKSLPFKLEYWAYIRLDLVAAHPQTAEILVDSGLRAATFGIETWNQQSGTAVGKGSPKQKQIDALKLMRTIGGPKFMMQANFIIGLPHESATSVLKTFDFLCSDENPIDSWSFIPFALENARNSRHGGDFSKIALDPEKYGYTVLEELDSNKLNWSNNWFTYASAKNLADKLNAKSSALGMKLMGRLSFEIAGLGLDFDKFSNIAMRDYVEVIESIYKQKLQRANQYRSLLCEQLQLPQLGPVSQMPCELSMPQEFISLFKEEI